MRRRLCWSRWTVHLIISCAISNWMRDRLSWSIIWRHWACAVILRCWASYTNACLVTPTATFAVYYLRSWSLKPDAAHVLGLTAHPVCSRRRLMAPTLRSFGVPFSGSCVSTTSSPNTLWTVNIATHSSTTSMYTQRADAELEPLSGGFAPRDANYIDTCE